MSLPRLRSIEYSQHFSEVLAQDCWLMVTSFILLHQIRWSQKRYMAPAILASVSMTLRAGSGWLIEEQEDWRASIQVPSLKNFLDALIVARRLVSSGDLWPVESISRQEYWTVLSSLSWPVLLEFSLMKVSSIL